MNNPLKLKLKIGQIEFESEGEASEVTAQRDFFMKSIVPTGAAFLDEMQEINDVQMIDKSTNAQFLPSVATGVNLIATDNKIDFSRTNLVTYLKKYGDLSSQDFVLFSAYYNEQKNAPQTYVFTIDDVKKYYEEARKPVYGNIAVLLNRLVQKGHIMDDANSEQKSPKPYIITADGIQYINNYAPNEKTEKKIKKVAIPKKKIESVYKGLNPDDLNLSKYPVVKDLKQSKEQVILAMYIITQENKGDWFKNSDIEYIMPNLFDVHITKDQITNAFRQKSWFNTKNAEDDPRSLTHKLLSQAKDFAKRVIAENLNSSL